MAKNSLSGDDVEILLVIGGVFLGIVLTKIFNREPTAYGVIDVEEESGLCRFRINDDKLIDKRVKKATFIVNHDAIISRDEQSL